MSKPEVFNVSQKVCISNLSDTKLEYEIYTDTQGTLCVIIKDKQIKLSDMTWGEAREHLLKGRQIARRGWPKHTYIKTTGRNVYEIYWKDSNGNKRVAPYYCKSDKADWYVVDYNVRELPEIGESVNVYFDSVPESLKDNGKSAHIVSFDEAMRQVRLGKMAKAAFWEFNTYVKAVTNDGVVLTTLCYYKSGKFQKYYYPNKDNGKGHEKDQRCDWIVFD